MKTKLCLLLLALCLGLTACIGPKRNRGPQSSSSGKEGMETVTLWTNREDYDLGEPVIIRWTVGNTSGRPLVLNGGREPVMDIVMMEGQTEEQRWSGENRELAKELVRLELEPGESYTIEWQWMPPQKSQQIYCVAGYWLRSDGLLGRSYLCVKVAWGGH